MKKLFLIIFILTLSFSVSGVSLAAITFDAGSRTNDGTPGTSTSWSHTAAVDSTAIISHGTSAEASSVTYNSIALIFIQDGGNVAKTQTYYLASTTIPDGANTMTWTWGPSDNFVGGAITLKGTLTDASVIGATATTSVSSATSISVNITTEAANSMNVDGVSVEGTHSNTASTGSNQTGRYSDNTFADLDGQGSTQPTTSAGSYTMSWSWTTSGGGRQSMVEFKEEVVAVAEVYQETEWWFFNTF